MAPSVGERLAALLSRASGQRFARGRHDCMLLVADWALALTGRDPAATLRGRYASAGGAERITAAAGGSRALLATALGKDWREVTAPRAGDILLVVPPRHDEAIAALAVEGGWAALVMVRGLAYWPVEEMRLLAAWRWIGVDTNG